MVSKKKLASEIAKSDTLVMAKNTYRVAFTSESKATEYWMKIGSTHNGERVVSNELEYLKSGDFEVITVTIAK